MDEEIAKKILEFVLEEKKARLNTLLNKAVHGLAPMEYNEVLELFDLLSNKILVTELYRCVVEYELIRRAELAKRREES